MPTNKIASTIKSAITETVKKGQESLKATRREIKQWQFDHKVSFKSAKVKAEVASPRIMGESEERLMKRARQCVTMIARSPRRDQICAHQQMVCAELLTLAEEAALEAKNQGLKSSEPLIKQAFADAVADLHFDELQSIRLKVLEFNAIAGNVLQGPGNPTKQTIDTRKLLLNHMMNACNVRLFTKDYRLLNHQLAKTKAVTEEAAVEGLIDWLLNPSKELVAALKGNTRLDDILPLVRELAVGANVYGEGRLLRCLFDEFSGDDLAIDLIEGLGRRAVALDNLTKGKKEHRDLNGTAWLMFKVHNAYYLSRQVHGSLKNGHTIWEPHESQSVPRPNSPTEADKAWAWSLVMGGDREVPLERDRRVAPEAAPRTDRKPPSDKGKEREVEAEAPVEPTTPEIARSSAPSPEVEAMMQALREGRNIEGLIGPLEVLAAKLDSPDFQSTWNSLVAAFRNSRRPFDLSRLKEFGTTLQEVANSKSTMKGFDKALQVARGAIKIAEAADRAYGRETPEETNEEVWGRLCDRLLRKYTAAARNEKSLSATIERTFNAIETMNVTEYCEALRRINETDAEQGSEQASAMVNGAFVQAIRSRSDDSLSILKNNSGKVHELLGQVLSERDEKNRPIFSDAEELLSNSQALKEWLEDPIEQSESVVRADARGEGKGKEHEIEGGEDDQPWYVRDHDAKAYPPPITEPTPISEPEEDDNWKIISGPYRAVPLSRVLSGPGEKLVPIAAPVSPTETATKLFDASERQQQIRHIAEEASDTSPRTQAKPRHLPRRFQRKKPAEPAPNRTSAKQIATPDDARPAEPQQQATVPPLVLPTALGKPEQQPADLSPRDRSGQPWNRTTPRSPRRSDLPANSESQTVVMPTPAASPASSEARPQSLRRTMAQAQPPRVKLVQSSGQAEPNRSARVSSRVSAPVSNSDGILAGKALLSSFNENDFGKFLSALKILAEARDIDPVKVVIEVRNDRIDNRGFRRFDGFMEELRHWLHGMFGEAGLDATWAIFATWSTLKRALRARGVGGNPIGPWPFELNKAKESLIKLYPNLAVLTTGAQKNRALDPVAPITEASPTIDELFDDADEDSEDGAEPADKSSGPEGKSIYNLFEDALSADDSSTGKTPARRLVTKEAQDGYDAIIADIVLNSDAPLSKSDHRVLSMRAEKLATAIGKPNFYSFYLELEALNRLQHIKGKDRADAITKAMKDKKISIEQLRSIDGIANNTWFAVEKSSDFATEWKTEIGQVMSVWAVIKTEANIGVASMNADRSVVRNATKALEEHYRDNFAPEMESDDDGLNYGSL